MMRNLSRMAIAALAFSVMACAEVEDFYDREIRGENEPSIIGLWQSGSACKDDVRVEIDFNDDPEKDGERSGAFTVRDDNSGKSEAVFAYDPDSGILKYKVTYSSGWGCRLGKSGYWEEVYINLGEDSLSIGSGEMKGEYEKVN